MRILTTIFALLLFITPGYAQDKFVIPEQQIVGGEEPIPLGELVSLNITPIETKPAHLHSSAYHWKVYGCRGNDLYEKRSITHKTGVFFGSGIQPCQLIAVCHVVHLYVVKDGSGDVAEIATRTTILTEKIQIGKGPQPPPDPGPGPGPDPGPNPPPPAPDLTGIAKFVYDTALKNVPPANRSAGAQALATSFNSIASSIAAGVVGGEKEVLQKTKAANLSALRTAGVSDTEWQPWSTILQDKLFDMYRNGEFRSLNDYANTWRSIAKGLRAVP